MQAKIKNFIRLLQLKKSLAKQVKENQTAIDWIEPEIRNYFGDQGIEKMTQNGLTIYIKRQLFAAVAKDESGAAVPIEECILALKLAGLDLYCEERIKMPTLNTYFKELDEDGVGLPAELEGKLVIKEVFKMASRTA